MANVTLVNYRTGATATVDQSLIAQYYLADPAWTIQTDAPSSGPTPSVLGINGTVGEFMKSSWNEELLTLSTGGLTTDTAGNLLPANSIIDAVLAYVNTTITLSTAWELGDATTATRFCGAQSGGQLTAGASVIGLSHWNAAVAGAAQYQAAAAKVRVTCTVANPGAGKLRIVVLYRSYGVPIV